MGVKEFGALVKSARYAQGMTVKELAEKTGITKTQINNIERGANRPRPATFTKLVDALGLDRNEAANLL